MILFFNCIKYHDIIKCNKYAFVKDNSEKGEFYNQLWKRAIMEHYGNSMCIFLKGTPIWSRFGGGKV